MSFLNQLKDQAQSLQSQRAAQSEDIAAQVAATDAACQRVWHYLDDLRRQLNVIEPPATGLSVDGKFVWPPMKQCDFRFDARKKLLRDKEVHDYLALGWRLAPALPPADLRGQVKVNFPPDLERVERRLRAGHVPHDRQELRHPETNGLLAIVFDFELAARASVLVTAEHEQAQLHFRLSAVNGLEVVSTRYRADQVTTEALDELAKLIVGQPSRFV